MAGRHPIDYIYIILWNVIKEAPFSTQRRCGLRLAWLGQRPCVGVRHNCLFDYSEILTQPCTVSSLLIHATPLGYHLV